MPARTHTVAKLDLDPGCLELGGELELRLTSLWTAMLSESRGPVSQTGAAVLADLHRCGALRITELAHQESVSQPTMTILLNRLEREGLVERRDDPEDGRATLITVTERGLEILADRARRRAQALGRRLEVLPARERAALRTAIPALDSILLDSRAPAVSSSR